MKSIVWSVKAVRQRDRDAERERETDVGGIGQRYICDACDDNGINAVDFQCVLTNNGSCFEGN